MSSPELLPAAIVLGVEHPRGLAVVQSLGRMGVPVVGVDRSRRAPGIFSRYVRESLVVPDQADATLAALESLGRYSGAVLIPTNDIYVEMLARNFESLTRRFIVTVPPWEITGTLMDKERCYSLARSIGLRTPRTFAPATAADLDRVLAGLDFDEQGYLLTKQMPLGATTDRLTNRYTRVGGLDAATLRSRCLEMLERSGELPLIAEIVPGEAASCVGVSMVLDRQLDSVAWFGVRRLQLRPYRKEEGFVHPYDLGANVYCESTHDEEAVDATRRLLQATGYYGTATVEFRRDTRDGALTVIKADTRFVRATGLSLALGVDLPRRLYLAFTDRPLPAAPSYSDGTAWIWLTWYIDAVRRQPLAIAARQIRTLLRNARKLKVAAYLSANDPLPFVVDFAQWSRDKVRRAARRFLRPRSPATPARDGDSPRGRSRADAA